MIRIFIDGRYMGQANVEDIRRERRAPSLLSGDLEDQVLAAEMPEATIFHLRATVTAEAFKELASGQGPVEVRLLQPNYILDGTAWVISWDARVEHAGPRYTVELLFQGQPHWREETDGDRLRRAVTEARDAG